MQDPTQSQELRPRNMTKRGLIFSLLVLSLSSHALYVCADEQETNIQENTYQSTDSLDDGLLDPIASYPSCLVNGGDVSSFAEDLNSECWNPPESTIEEEELEIDVTCLYGGNDPDDTCEDSADEDADSNEDDDAADKDQQKTTIKKRVDKHWGHDENTLRMRDTLRNMGTKDSQNQNTKRPPIFLLPGLASTRLVAWKHKTCKHKLLSDVKVLEYMWLHVGKLIEMATIDSSCWEECMSLGRHQTDMDVEGVGCKVRRIA